MRRRLQLKRSSFRTLLLGAVCSVPASGEAGPRCLGQSFPDGRREKIRSTKETIATWRNQREDETVTVTQRFGLAPVYTDAALVWLLCLLQHVNV